MGSLIVFQQLSNWQSLSSTELALAPILEQRQGIVCKASLGNSRHVVHRDLLVGSEVRCMQPSQYKRARGVTAAGVREN